MKPYRKRQFVLCLLLMMLVAALTMCVIGMSPLPVQAKGPCDVAADYGGHSTFWNFLCAVELMFDYLFLYG